MRPKEIVLRYEVDIIAVGNPKYPRIQVPTSIIRKLGLKTGDRAIITLYSDNTITIEIPQVVIE